MLPIQRLKMMAEKRARTAFEQLRSAAGRAEEEAEGPIKVGRRYRFVLTPQARDVLVGGSGVPDEIVGVVRAITTLGPDELYWIGTRSRRAKRKARLLKSEIFSFEEVLPERCPECSSPKVGEIFYGHPRDEHIQAARRGEIVLGGATPGGPRWACRACGNTW